MGDDGDIGPVARGQPREPRNPTLTLEVATEGPAWTCLAARRPASLARRVASALAQSHQLPARRTTATLLLSTDANVRVLNKQWRGIDTPTNVLSFPSPATPSPRARTTSARHLGDLILAEQTLEREAGEMGIDVADHYRHLVLHGLLHLLGHDHETDAEAEMMEALETRILASLGVADPYAGSEPVKSSTAAPQRGGLQGARAR